MLLKLISQVLQVPIMSAYIIWGIVCIHHMRRGVHTSYVVWCAHQIRCGVHTLQLAIHNILKEVHAADLISKLCHVAAAT